MSHPIRLTAHFVDDTTVQFVAQFAAPEPDLPGPGCAPVRLETGDGTILELGMLCPPGSVTWPGQGAVDLATHTFTDPNLVHRAQLQWGDVTLPMAEMGSRDVAPAVELVTFLVQPEPKAMQVRVKVKVAGLAGGWQVRVDGGCGQRGMIQAGAEAEQSHEWLFGYPKPGDYGVTVDLLDGEGFAVARLGESPVHMAEPVDYPKSVPAKARLGFGETLPSTLDGPAPGAAARLDVSPAAMEALSDAAQQPWLPFRYAYPLWAWARTYTAPGGNTIARSLAPGTYLAIRSETYAGGQLWYQTGSYDWVPSSSVGLFVPSELRGVEVGMAPPPAPDPDPTPLPQPIKRGVVTANRLNVRAQPGTGANNPPVDQVALNTTVDIFEETTVAGALWYRIGPGADQDRWVHSGWVHITETVTPAPDPEPSPAPEPTPDPLPLKQGKVTATRLNVRARPGTSANNPPVDQVTLGTVVEIWEEQTVAGAVWYRIGPGANRDRWVHSGYVADLPASRGMQARGAVVRSTDAGAVALPLGWVTSAALNVRAVPGVSSSNPPVDQLAHYDRVPILESRTVAGAVWYRIGADRWVYGGYVGVARDRARPRGIGPTERWVSVCLSEQTLVAYEGDTPVYACLVATGLPGTPTVQGTFRTYWRVDSRRMTGGVPGTADYYYIEEVTWTCYFYGGYALHTAYWQDAFGNPRSHGCVNMSPYDAWWIFQWSGVGGANSPAVHLFWA